MGNGEGRLYEEVLPSVLKTGGYTLPDFSNPAEAARAWAEQYELKLEAEQEKLQLEHKIAEDEPYTQYGKTASASDGSLNLSETAKSFGIGPSKFTELLRNEGFIFRRDKKRPDGSISRGVNQPIQRYFVRSSVFFF